MKTTFLPGLFLLAATLVFSAACCSGTGSGASDGGDSSDVLEPPADDSSAANDAVDSGLGDGASDHGSFDAGTDTGADAGHQDDDAFDASSDAGTDNGPPDAGTDAGTDAGHDGGQPAGGPVWFLHITDSHIGENLVAAPNDLAAFLGKVLPNFGPAVTLHTGDLTDSGVTTEFDSYWGIINGQVPAYPGYVEVVGNHDVKANGVTNFLAGSLTGRAGAGAYGVTYVDTPAGRIQIIRTNTADSSSNTINISGYFGTVQMNDLLALPPSPTPVVFSVLEAHHSPALLATLGTKANMEQVLAHFGTQIYFCGHVHTSAIAWDNQTLVVQGATLGAGSGTAKSFMLAAIDDDGPSDREISIDYTLSPYPVQWPLVLITRPGDSSLSTTNPIVAKITPGQSGVALRALAFAPSTVTAAEYRIDAGGWTAMSGPGPVWAATFTAPSVVGSHTLEVQATSSEGTTSHGIKIQVSN